MLAHAPVASHDRTLADDLTSLHGLANRSVASAGDLAANLQTMYRQLFDVDLAAYDIATQRANAAYAMQSLLEFRLALRAQIEPWAARGFMTHEVQKALRDVMRVTRYASDMVGELAIAHARVPVGGQTMAAFTGRDRNVLVNPAYQTGGDLPFQSGDLIVMRGQAHNSAAIARIGDIDSQFSHVGIVHVDASGAPVLVEALIESGAVVTPLAAALSHGLGRAVLFRPRDAVLAAKAAAAIYDHVSRRRRRRIWYDFTMALNGYKTLYCSKLVRLAFLKASNGTVKFPAYTTHLVRRNRDFLDRVGVKAAETFAPADLEIDPRVDLVAEWADYRVTGSLRTQDMIATKLFQFMEDKDYRFEEDWTIRLIAWLGRVAARLSESAKDAIAGVFPKVPPNMKRRTIAVIAMLHKTAQPLLEDLDARGRAVIAATGHSPHPRDLLSALDAMEGQGGGRIGYLVSMRPDRVHRTSPSRTR